MKHSQLAGVLFTIVLILSGLMNWAWYPDLQQYFTGFYSYNNNYGKPGKAFIILGVIAIAFYLIPRIWAKRCNMFLCVLILGYAIKTFILFSACYRGTCPEKQAGLWIMLSSAALMLIASLLPDLKLKNAD
ncbi:MAG: hypothetical protein J7497_09120 [Chitinophagaceae bacterium]|nr:hypothetical protein [Chitinophagaceae bacterium]